MGALFSSIRSSTASGACTMAVKFPVQLCQMRTAPTPTRSAPAPLSVLRCQAVLR
jgi:hypothetical protein